MNSGKTSFKKIRKTAKKVVSKEANNKCISKETTTSGLKETSQEEISELPSISQALKREKLPKKRKSKSTRKVASKKIVKNLRLNPKKAQINQTILYVHSTRKCILRVKIGLRVIYVIDGMILFVQI